MKPQLPKHPLMLVTPITGDIHERIDRAIAGGVNMIQLRDKTATTDELQRTVRALRTTIRDRALLIVNSDTEAAREADGIHFPEPGVGQASSLSPLSQQTLNDQVTASPDKGDRLETCPTPLLGFSVHSVETAIDAEHARADYLIVGTIFDSASHPGAPTSGISLLRKIRAETDVPLIAIGGITPENARACLAAGASGIAALSPFQSSDPCAVAQAYQRELTMIDLVVNGKPITLEKPMSISEFLASKNLHERLVVVEHNREIVPRDRYSNVQLGTGDAMEIVQMMAGG